MQICDKMHVLEVTLDFTLTFLSEYSGDHQFHFFGIPVQDGKNVDLMMQLYLQFQKTMLSSGSKAGGFEGFSFCFV